MSEHENQLNDIKSVPKSKNKVKGFFKFLAMVLALSVGKLAIKYVTAEVHVNASRYTAWDQNFKKDFIEICATSAQKELTSLVTKEQLSAPTTNAKLKLYSQDYCNCITNKIEAKHIFPTKYNTMTRSIAQYENETTKAVEEYIASEQGKVDVNSCLSKIKVNL